MIPVLSNVKAEDIKIYLYLKWFFLAAVFLLNIFENLVKLTTLIQGTIAYLGIFIAAITALLLDWSIRNNKYLEAISHFSLSVDILIIILVLYLHGGVQNSWLFLPTFIIFLATYIFGLKIGFIYAVFSFILVLFMAVLQYIDLLPQYPLFSLPQVYWKNSKYIFDYLASMFVLYFASVFCIGYLVSLANQRAKSEEEFSKRVNALNEEEKNLLKTIDQKEKELMVKEAEYEKFERISAESQTKLIELIVELKELKLKRQKTD